MNKPINNKLNPAQELLKNLPNTGKEDAAPVKRDNEFSFEVPAITVNNFQLAITPSYARLAGLEISHGGKPHVRSVMSFDYVTLAQLHNLLGRFLAQLEENKKAEQELHAKAEEEANKDRDENAETSNNQKTKVV